VRIRKASGLIAWILRRTGFGGVTLPWSIYILPERIEDKALRMHELIHAEQIERMGVLRFYLVYLYQVIRYGYQNAPLEIEARNVWSPAVYPAGWKKL